MTSYFDNDFDLNDFRETFENELNLIEIKSEEIEGSMSYRESNCGEDMLDLKWNSFFETHNNGDFFKPRNYILNEFDVFLKIAMSNSMSKNDDVFILEIGSGYGCTLLPLIQQLYINNPLKSNLKFIATDYSPVALSILRNNKIYKDFEETKNHDVLQTEVWDVTLPLTSSLQFITSSCTFVLSIFAISAIHPDHHINTFYNIASTMHSGGYLLVSRTKYS